VSERDASTFRNDNRIRHVATIPTGVDLTYFSHALPPAGGAPVVTFTGSMDWAANIDGIKWFMDEIWPCVRDQHPDAQFRVIGRNPPESLIAEARARGLSWNFTGFVDDVREHLVDAQVYVIPLRVGGGTRIKAYEAMARGIPVVSTGLGIEGLPVEDGVHYLGADDAGAFAEAIIRLLDAPALGGSLSRAARGFVEANFGAEKVATAFEAICLETLSRAAPDDDRGPNGAKPGFALDQRCGPRSPLRGCRAGRAHHNRQPGFFTVARSCMPGCRALRPDATGR
jgi:glycosyltransferase involved in cell wall biosynthesis